MSSGQPGTDLVLPPWRREPMYEITIRNELVDERRFHMKDKKPEEDQEPTMSRLPDNQYYKRQRLNGRPFNPSDPSSDGIEPDGTLNDDYASFWLGD